MIIGYRPHDIVCMLFCPCNSVFCNTDVIIIQLDALFNIDEMCEVKRINPKNVNT